VAVGTARVMVRVGKLRYLVMETVEVYWTTAGVLLMVVMEDSLTALGEGM
jgi:hypothetical protein